MRSLLVILIVFGAVPFIFTKPHIGAYVWAWIGFMNPHRLTWGVAHNFPFALLIAGATLIGIFVTKEARKFPGGALTTVWIMLVLWMCFTTLFALIPERAYDEWLRMFKIQVMTFVTILLVQKRERLHILVWVVAMSLAFYGIKGGVFSALTGGRYMVWGPEGTFISGNNSLALALVMTLPLLRYLQMTTVNRWVKWGLTGAMGLCALSILSSYSRGAFLALSAMAMFLTIKSRKRGMIIVGIIIAIPILYQFMPEKWFDRMETIQTYEEDRSAMGRINAWWFAFNIAKANPITGGGFNTFDPELFKRYAPNPDDFHDAHSIYFEMLGEHGFIGLLIFLSLGVTAFFTGGSILRKVKDRPDLKWAYDLASMVQVSLIGYAIGGAFLGLAYFDLYYTLIAFLIVTRLLVNEELNRQPEETPVNTTDAVKRSVYRY